MNYIIELDSMYYDCFKEDGSSFLVDCVELKYMSERYATGATIHDMLEKITQIRYACQLVLYFMPNSPDRVKYKIIQEIEQKLLNFRKMCWFPESALSNER